MTLHSEAVKEIDLDALRGHTPGPWECSWSGAQAVGFISRVELQSLDAARGDGANFNATVFARPTGQAGVTLYTDPPALPEVSEEDVTEAMKAWTFEFNLGSNFEALRATAQPPAPGESVRQAWRAAITLANNICAQESDRENDADGNVGWIDGTAECAKRIRAYVEPTNDELLEMLHENGATAAIAALAQQRVPDAETAKLIEFFRKEGYMRFDLNGDNMGWSPAETAIRAMREYMSKESSLSQQPEAR